MINSTNGGVKGASRGRRTPMEDQGGTLNRTSFEYTVIFFAELWSLVLQEAYKPSLFVVHCVHPPFHPSTATVQASLFTVCSDKVLHPDFPHSDPHNETFLTFLTLVPQVSQASVPSLYAYPRVMNTFHSQDMYPLH
ncbi:hypothetical protein Pcinc_037248 [Petrolisthes cinctipes]|uniref:Uncharacterized protein n=1 Tax=Petrolisthes cinctipes TaxID=88211 RepID=A0AAE1BTY2_PETCI|nr:hypothetical protein Pcinc_037248 [Petrolisthes cinctipes]